MKRSESFNQKQRILLKGSSVGGRRYSFNFEDFCAKFKVPLLGEEITTLVTVTEAIKERTAMNVGDPKLKFENL